MRFVQQLRDCGFLSIEIWHLKFGGDLDSAVKCWGENGNGQLGLGDTVDRGLGVGSMGSNLPFVELGSTFTPITIVAGSTHACAISTNHTLKVTMPLAILALFESHLFLLLQCWGSNAYGQLGIGDSNARGDDSNEMGDNLQVANLGDGFLVADIACSDHWTCASSLSGHLKCFGMKLHRTSSCLIFLYFPTILLKGYNNKGQVIMSLCIFSMFYILRCDSMSAGI